MKGKDWFALVLVVLGLLLLGDNLGLFKFSYIFKLWPLALIIIGIGMFMKKEGRSGKSATVEVSFQTVKPEEPERKAEPEKAHEDDDDEDEI